MPPKPPRSPAPEEEETGLPQVIAIVLLSPAPVVEGALPQDTAETAQPPVERAPDPGPSLPAPVEGGDEPLDVPDPAADPPPNPSTKPGPDVEIAMPGGVLAPPPDPPDMCAALRSVFTDAGFLPEPESSLPRSAEPPAHPAPAGRALAPLVVELAQTSPDAEMDLLLAPEELGRLRIAFRQEGADLQVLLTAERPEIQDLLRRHAPLLTAELRLAGFDAATLNFGAWGDAPPPDPAPGPEPSPAPAPVSAPSPVKALPPGTGLDLRL